MHRPVTISAHRRHVARVWAGTIAACAIGSIALYLLVVGALATAVAWGWTA